MYVTSDFIGCTCFINQEVGVGITFKNSFKSFKSATHYILLLGFAREWNQHQRKPCSNFVTFEKFRMFSKPILVL